MGNNKKPATKFFQAEVDDYKKEFYESGYRTFMSVRLERFVDEIDGLHLTKDARCLDAGCGPGYLTKALYDRGYLASALDASPEMLRLARSHFETKLENEWPEFKEGDIENLPFESEIFDLVASAGVIEYLSQDSTVMAEFNRVLKPNGILILSSTNKFSPIGLFEPVIEALKRNYFFRNIFNWMLRKMGGTPIRPREFHVRKHSSKSFKQSAEKAGFEVIKIKYFYGLPWPHPFDRIFPRFSDFLGRKLEYFSDSVLGRTFEGIYIVARKKLRDNK